MAAAIPTDGSTPGTALDVGGPGLAQLCEQTTMPIPADVINIICGGALVGHTAPPGVAGSSSVSFDPGTYWVVLVCDAPGTVVVSLDVPGLPAQTTLACATDGTAVYQRLGTVAGATVGDVGNSGTATATTDLNYLIYLVREGAGQS